RRTDCDHIARRRVALHDAAAGEQLACACGGSEDGDVVAVYAQPGRDARDVLVHVVWLRPRKRGHKADAHGVQRSTGPSRGRAASASANAASAAAATT